jgi:hypothetical protein
MFAGLDGGLRSDRVARHDLAFFGFAMRGR